jgi:hypothetical protein
MHWEFIVVLIIAIPIILFPVIFIWWYMNAGGIYRAIQESRKRRRTAQEQEKKMEAMAEKAKGQY